jgi:hypothetical protein
MKSGLMLALLAGAAFTGGCDFGTDASFLAGPDPKPPVCNPLGGPSINLSTGVRSASTGTSFMPVGGAGTATMLQICEGGATEPLANTTFISRNPAVVSVVGNTLRALALGQAVIVGGQSGSYYDSATVSVVAVLADSVKVSLQSGWEGSGARYDSTNNLVEVSVSLHESVYPVWSVFLDGWFVSVDSVSISSANPSVAVATAHCRPKELDPSCSVVGPHWWVTAMSAGEASITVTVPNSTASTSFVVKVQ